MPSPSCGSPENKTLKQKSYWRFRCSKNMRIGPRLIAAFMVLVLISVIIGAVGLFGADKINDKAE